MQVFDFFARKKAEWRENFFPPRFCCLQLISLQHVAGCIKIEKISPASLDYGESWGIVTMLEDEEKTLVASGLPGSAQ